MTGLLPAIIQVMQARISVAVPLAPARERDEEAQRFEAMYRGCFPAVRAYAQRRLPARADDVVAETFLVAWRRFDDVPSDALPWLYSTARRVVSDLRRSSRRQEAVAGKLAAVDAPLDHETNEPDATLLAALARLSEVDRELLLLVYWEDLEPRRAALALGCSRATLATRLWRAHSRLRSQLERMETRP